MIDIRESVEPIIYEISAEKHHMYRPEDDEPVKTAEYLLSKNGRSNIIRLLQKSIKTDKIPIRISAWEYNMVDFKCVGLRVFYYIEKEVKRTKSLLNRCLKLEDSLEKVFQDLGLKFIPSPSIGSSSSGWKRLDTFELKRYRDEKKKFNRGVLRV